MTWQQATVTKKGLALQAKLIDGKTLRFTRVAAGAGKVDAGALADAVAVTDERQTLTLQPPNTLEGARIRVPVLLTNIGLQTGYQMHQIGFFATDPDEGEILYAIAQDDTGDRIPSETEARGFAADWVYVFEFGNAESVNVQLDPAGLISIGQLGKPGGVAQLGDNGALPIAQGGTGATTAEAARDKLGAGTPDNIFYNWYFKAPIKQWDADRRTEGSGGYLMDGWLDNAHGGKITLTNEGALVPEMTLLFQRFEPDFARLLHGKTLTASVLLANNELETATFVFHENKVEDHATLSGSFRCGSADGYHWCGWYPSKGAQTVVAMELVLGSTSTLAHKNADGMYVLNRLPDVTAARIRCQRYVQAWGNPDLHWIGVGAPNISDNLVQCFIPLSNPMRTLPAAIGTVHLFDGRTTYGPFPVKPENLSATSVRCLVSAPDFPKDKTCFLFVPAEESLIFSAEL